MNESYIRQLVDEWDDVYKKGQLSLWLLLAIADGRKYAAQLSEYMYRVTDGSFSVTDQSLYRALRRFEAMKVVRSIKIDSPNGGSPRKYFELTDTGHEVLRRFVELHVRPLMKPEVQQLLTTLKRSTL
jgi:PadR family transcriptional regulator PadR